MAGAGVLLALGLIALLAAGPRLTVAAYVGLGVGLLLTLSGITASRAYGDGRAGAALGGLALPYAFVGGALLIGQSDRGRVGVLDALPWLGGPELLAGSTAVLLLAALGAVGVSTSLRIFAAGTVVGVLGAVGALASFVTSPAGAAAIVVSLLVCGIGMLPLLAIRFGKMPTPPVTLPTGGEAEETFTGARDLRGDAVRERPGRTRVFAAVSRTEELLTGMLIGHAIVAAFAFLVLAESTGAWVRVLTAVAAAALLLRSRLFVTRRQRVPLIIGGLAGVLAFGIGMLAGAGELTILAVAVAGALLAVVTVVAGGTWSRKAPSPYLGRAADLLDGLAVIAVIPVACAVVGLYGLVAGINFGI
jgi:type VII secretion integral membrane protein EccD